MKKNLWILTEERPKKSVLASIIKLFAEDNHCGFFKSDIRILPILNSDFCFTFVYEVVGFTCAKIDRIYLRAVSGSSSFTDFLVFHQDHEPTISDVPLYAIEETKTDDSESRNTGVYQRCSKFVYIQYFFPTVKLVMLYNLQITQKKSPTNTYIFGTRLLLTLGVKVVGKQLDENIFKPVSSVEEVISIKDNMRKAPKGNVPILLKKEGCKIEISGRLYKAGSLSHDPNIGALTLISAVLRKLGWVDKIEITEHGLEQKNIGQNNKFVQIASILDISLYGLEMPTVNIDKSYWHYETKGEKLGTIFIHTVIESFTHGYSIFENHAGCEKGYFVSSNGDQIPLAKYKDRGKYKAGDKSQIINIPDIIMIDFDRNEVVNVEGKKYQFRNQGIKDLDNYDYIEAHYISKYYPKFSIIRTVVLYGSTEEEIIEIEVGFLLNENGKLILGVESPAIIKEAVKNLLDYWN